jgi:hypothetical protein
VEDGGKGEATHVQVPVGAVEVELSLGGFSTRNGNERGELVFGSCKRAISEMGGMAGRLGETHWTLLSVE